MTAERVQGRKVRYASRPGEGEQSKKAENEDDIYRGTMDEGNGK